MVSIKTIGTIGIILGAAVAFVSLGGAEGIGRRIGGGFSSFGNALVSSFTSGLGGVAGGGVTTPANQNPHPEIPTVDGVNTPNDILVQHGRGDEIINPDIPIATAFKESLQAGEITESFARRFSFKPEPTKRNVLDVSKTFEFLSETEGSSFDPTKGSRGSNITPFGGYQNATSQEAALVAAIERSSLAFPEFFG